MLDKTLEDYKDIAEMALEQMALLINGYIGSDASATEVLEQLALAHKRVAEVLDLDPTRHLRENMREWFPGRRADHEDHLDR